MSKELRNHARSLVENWRATLPTFRPKNKQAQQAWNEYLAGCTDPHKREVARFVATWASLIDQEYRNVSDATAGIAKKPNMTLEPSPPSDLASALAIMMVEGAKQGAKSRGATSQRSLDETIELIKQVSVWDELVAKWEKERPEFEFGSV